MYAVFPSFETALMNVSGHGFAHVKGVLLAAVISQDCAIHTVAHLHDNIMSASLQK